MKNKDLSPLAQSALALDEDFAELGRLSGEISRLEVDSDAGLARSKILLERFRDCGARIGEGVQALAKALEDSRAAAEQAAAIVETKAPGIHARQEEVNRLSARFQSLSEMVHQVNAGVGELRQNAKEGMSSEEREMLLKHLPEIDSKLGLLIDEAQKIREEAQTGKMRGLERNADSLSQTLQSVRRKLSVVEPRSTLH